MISVIVPYHNSSKYLRECIESVLNQTYSDWELILVNDSSTDNGQEICKEYADKNPKIIIAESKGAGVSSARNTGLDIARGKYVTFLDSDDWLEADALDIFQKEIECCDLVFASYRKRTDVDVEEIIKYTSATNHVKKTDFITLLFASKKLYLGYCWGKIFRTDIIRNHNIKFNTSIAYNEDRLFVLEYTLKITTILFRNKVVYNYRQHNESAMAKFQFEQALYKKKIEDELLSAKIMSSILDNHYPVGQTWLEYKLLRMAYQWKKEISDSTDHEWKSRIEGEIRLLESRVRRNKEIDLISKMKLLKAKYNISFKNMSKERK
jgi:glycosyltransferase involved in cell wall biosynthesis